MRMLTTFPFLAGVAALVAIAPGAASAQSERVCRQECVGAVCQEKCVERRDETIGRRDRRDTIIEERREERRPGIELRVPVPIPGPNVDIEVGR
jgi:hypothetical protein